MSGHDTRTTHRAVTTPLRVGLTVGRGTQGGIARYSRELHGALCVRSDVVVIPIGSSAALRGLDLHPGEAIVVPTARQLGDALYTRVMLGRRIDELKLDVLHSTRHLLPHRASCPTLLTVHDLFAFERRQDFPWLKRLILPRWFRQCVSDADRLLCVSDATRAHLAHLSESLLAKSLTVRSAVPEELLAAQPQRPHGIGDFRFALVVSDMSPRKNVGLLVRIWPAIFSATGLLLVVAGSAGWRSNETVRDVEDLASRGCAKRLGAVSDSELRWLYETATLVLAPSFAEGWGFPVEEGLAFGATVVASNHPAVAEAAAGQAVLLDPFEPLEWQETISRLASRQRTVSGAHRVKRSWADVAEDTVKVYRALASERKSRGGIRTTEPARSGTATLDDA